MSWLIYLFDHRRCVALPRRLLFGVLLLLLSIHAGGPQEWRELTREAGARWAVLVSEVRLAASAPEQQRGTAGPPVAKPASSAAP